MAKHVVVFMLYAVLAIQGAPPISFDAIIEAAQEAANNGKWDIVQNVLANKYDYRTFQPDISSVRHLTPVPGGHVYGESELVFHSSQDQGGSKVNKTAGHKIVNNDGHVKEYGFNPDSNKKAIVRDFLELMAGTRPPQSINPGDLLLEDGSSVSKHDYQLLFEHQVTPMFKSRPREVKALNTPSSFDDIVRTVNGLLTNKFQDMFTVKQTNFGGVKDLKPIKGGHVYGQSELTLQTSSADARGKKVEHSTSHRVINKDGMITEFGSQPNEKDLAKHFIELLLSMSANNYPRKESE